MQHFTKVRAVSYTQDGPNAGMFYALLEGSPVLMIEKVHEIAQGIFSTLGGPWHFTNLRLQRDLTTPSYHLWTLEATAGLDKDAKTPRGTTLYRAGAVRIHELDGA